MIEFEKYRRKSLEAFKDVGEKKSPFRKGSSHSQNKLHAEGAITRRRDQVIETNIINILDSRVRLKIIAEGNFNIGVQQHKLNTSLENLKKVSFTSNSKLVPPASMTLIHPVLRKLFTEEIPNVPLAGRLSQFVKLWKKNYTRPRNFVNSERVSDTIHKSPSSEEASKHNKNVRTTISASGPGEGRRELFRKQKQLRRSF